MDSRTKSSSTSKFISDKRYSLGEPQEHRESRGTSVSVLELSKISTDVEDEQKIHPEGKERRSRMVYVTAMAAMCSAVCTGYSSVYAEPATFDMKTRNDSKIKVTDEEVSWIENILPIGTMVAIPLAVYLADRIGRKQTVIMSSIPSLISWITTIYAPNVLFIQIGRFFGGFASALVLVALPMYAVEISSAYNRGLIGASFQACIAIGSLTVMGLGTVLAWPWLAVVGLIAVTISLVILIPMPESPRWLVAKGMKGKAVKAIQFLHADQIDAILECQMIEDAIKAQTETKFSIQNLKQPTIYKPALISIGQMVIVPFTGAIVILVFSSMILSNAKSILNPKYSTIIVGAVQVVGTILSTLLMDKAGRRALLLVSGFLMGISQATLGAYFYISTHDSTISLKLGWLPLTSAVFSIAVFSIGYGPIPRLMLSEMVPTRERSFISGVATLTTALLTFAVIKTFEDIRNVMNFHGAFWTYSSVCFLSCVFVYFLVPETKEKQLEEIQKIFSRVRTTDAETGLQKSPKEGFNNSSFS